MKLFFEVIVWYEDVSRMGDGDFVVLTSCDLLVEKKKLVLEIPARQAGDVHLAMPLTAGLSLDR